jgi:hypothetical protein
MVEGPGNGGGQLERTTNCFPRFWQIKQHKSQIERHNITSKRNSSNYLEHQEIIVSLYQLINM